jgi:hypothetical protein
MLNSYYFFIINIRIRIYLESWLQIPKGLLQQLHKLGANCLGCVLRQPKLHELHYYLCNNQQEVHGRDQ